MHSSILMTLSHNRLVRFASHSLLVVVVASCASMSRKEQGAVIGAGTGAAVGAAIGHANGSTSRGAILGAVVGGTVGGVIGHQMDQQAKELAQNIPTATVERVGEGIQVTFCHLNSGVVAVIGRSNGIGNPLKFQTHRQIVRVQHWPYGRVGRGRD